MTYQKTPFLFLPPFTKKSRPFSKLFQIFLFISLIKHCSCNAKGKYLILFSIVTLLVLVLGLNYIHGNFSHKLILCGFPCTNPSDVFLLPVFLLDLAVGDELEDLETYQMKKRAKVARRSLKKFAKTVSFYLRKGWEAIAICLTYKDLSEWERGKRSLSRYMNTVRMWIKRKFKSPVFYCWVREMQERGVPHYHILLVVPRNVRIPKPDQSWWSHGFSNIKLLRFRTWRRIERYLVDYLEEELEEIDGQEILRYSHVFGVSRLFKTDTWWYEVDFHRYLKKICKIRFGDKPIIDVVRVGSKLKVSAIKFKDLYFKTYSEMSNFILDLIHNRKTEDDYYLALADQLGW